jgi:hypothetical protein
LKKVASAPAAFMVSIISMPLTVVEYSLPAAFALARV